MSSNQFAFFVLVGFLTSCANGPSKVTDAGRLNKLSRQSQYKLDQQEDRKLNTLVKFEKSFKTQKTYPLPQPRTEESLYAGILQAYQARDLDRLSYFNDEFSRRYPKSVFSDNALYLTGQLKLALGLPSEALRDFEKLLNEYPMGNKRSAALFGKGVAYRKLQLYQYAEKVLKEVKRGYPGSPEFFKVDLELKLLQVERGA